MVTNNPFAVAKEFSRPRLVSFARWRNIAAARTKAEKPCAGTVFLSFVRGTGIEPARPYEHYHLKVACLPISTPARFVNIRRDAKKSYSLFCADTLSFVGAVISSTITSFSPSVSFAKSAGTPSASGAIIIRVRRSCLRASRATFSRM